MSEIERMLFQLQKSHILTWFFGNESRTFVTPAYAYAWYKGIFPFRDDSAEWHYPYANFFQISEEQMTEFFNFLCDQWEANTPICFYDLEKHYGINDSNGSGPIWTRSTLLHACKYLFLHDAFDSDFWDALTENGKCPPIAHSIKSNFDPDCLYLL